MKHFCTIAWTATFMDLTVLLQKLELTNKGRGPSTFLATFMWFHLVRTLSSNSLARCALGKAFLHLQQKCTKSPSPSSLGPAKCWPLCIMPKHSLLNKNQSQCRTVVSSVLHERTPPRMPCCYRAMRRAPFCSYHAFAFQQISSRRPRMFFTASIASSFFRRPFRRLSAGPLSLVSLTLARVAIN